MEHGAVEPFVIEINQDRAIRRISYRHEPSRCPFMMSDTALQFIIIVNCSSINRNVNALRTPLLGSLCRCGYLPFKSTVSVTQSNDTRMHFTGKGTGAGMIMSSMGPVGIAIGVTIDEDIGKTVVDVNIAKLADSTFQLLSQRHPQQQSLNPYLVEYFFESAQGVDNAVVPKIISDMHVGERETRRRVVPVFRMATGRDKR